MKGVFVTVSLIASSLLIIVLATTLPHPGAAILVAMIGGVLAAVPTALIATWLQERRETSRVSFQLRQLSMFPATLSTTAGNRRPVTGFSDTAPWWITEDEMDHRRQTTDYRNLPAVIRGQSSVVRHYAAVYAGGDVLEAIDLDELSCE